MQVRHHAPDPVVDIAVAVRGYRGGCASHSACGIRYRASPSVLRIGMDGVLQVFPVSDDSPSVTDAHAEYPPRAFPSSERCESEWLPLRARESADTAERSP